MTEQEIQILEAMLSRIEQCEETNRILINANKELVRGNQALSDSLNTLRHEYECYVDNSRYEIFDPRIDKTEIFYPNIYTIEETMYELLNTNGSLCRFGDGEFACISGNLRAKFTRKYDKKLSVRLQEVLSCQDGDIMIAIADNYGDLSGYVPQSRREIRNYMTSHVRREHAMLLDRKRFYYNAYITRPFMFLYNDMRQLALYMKRFAQLWNGKKVVMIEGRNTGFGVRNDLLEDCKEVKRIIAPPVDAFDKYDEILTLALDQDDDSLYLIALGPAATVLAYDLAKTGRRAIDIGHLDIEYEWMKRGQYRVPVPNKYVNEVVDGSSPAPIDDPDYKKQIIAEIY